jgi:hypothetical protein
MRPTSAPGAAPKGHRVGDIPLRRRDRILPGRPAAVTLGPFSRIATPCLLARPRSELRQRLVHLALKPTPIHIGRWRPEPSQNLRHLAARKARPGRRAALGLIHRHRHNHHPFAAACAHGGSLRWPPEPTVSSKRTRCARCSSRASTTKLSRRLPSTRSPARRGTPRRSPRRPPAPARGAARGLSPWRVSRRRPWCPVGVGDSRGPADCREMILRRRRPTLNPPEEAA